MKIITNNHPRDIISGDELTADERKEFDYIDWNSDVYDQHFFRYKGNVYDLGDCEVWTGFTINILAGWSGYYSESFFSGVVFRYTEDMEQVIVGRYYT